MPWRTAGLRFVEPKIEINVKSKIDEDAASAKIEIYNLALNREQTILTRGEDINIEAGYRDHHALVFSGSIQQALPIRRNLNRITTITATGQAVSLSRLGGVTNRSYSGSVSVRVIIRDLVLNDLKMPLGDISHVPNHFTEDWYWVGEDHRGPERPDEGDQRLLVLVRTLWLHRVWPSRTGPEWTSRPCT